MKQVLRSVLETARSLWAWKLDLSFTGKNKVVAVFGPTRKEVA